ncbi:hypothetical protein H7H73_00420, partial [Mycobacterium rufum]|nr:hypothetical protein [Mycolicibacterium rufum]
MAAAVDTLVGCGAADLATRAELIDVLDELETVGCRLPAIRHRLLARLQVETRTCQDFCVCGGGLQVGVDAFGVVQDEGSECLFPAVGAGSFDEA